MSTIGAIIIGLFVSLVIISFGFQLYVASKLYPNPLVALLSISRGTRVFAQGWRRADELKIRDLMQLWTGVIVALVVMICPVAVVAATRDSTPDTDSVNSSGQSPTRNPNASPTPTPYDWQIVYPPYGSQVRRGTFLEPIIIDIRGSVQFDPAQIEYYAVHVCEIETRNNNTYSIPCGAESDSRRYEPQPLPDSVLFQFNTEMLLPGQYAIGVGFQHRNSDRYDGPTEQGVENQVWITIVE